MSGYYDFPKSCESRSAQKILKFLSRIADNGRMSEGDPYPAAGVGMISRLRLLFLFGFWLGACDPGVVHLVRYPGGKVKEMWTEKGPAGTSTLREGAFLSFYPDGSRESAVAYHGGKKDGEASFWRKDGRLTFRGKYRQDFLVKEERWDASGSKVLERRYRVREAPTRVAGPAGDSLSATEACAWLEEKGSAPVKHGLCLILNPGGRTQSTRYYHLGKLHGPVNAWHPDGNPWMQGAYEGGQPSGTWRIFSLDGKPLWQASFLHGEKHGSFQEWFQGGGRKTKSVFAKGRLEGTYQEWYPNGNLRRAAQYRAGRLEGRETAWYPDGAKLFSAGYAAGLQEGEFSQWYPGGNLRLQCRFREGRKEGPSRVWHPDGRPMEHAFYRDGKLHGSYRSWTGEGKLLVAKEFRDGAVAFDSKAKEILDLLGAGQLRVPVGCMGFYWGMAPKECRANLALRGGAEIKESEDEITGRFTCFPDRKPTSARLRLQFNGQGELWSIRMDLLQEGSGDFFRICESLEAELGSELGASGMRAGEGRSPYFLTRKRDWGRFSATTGGLPPISQVFPVVSAESFSPGNRGWFRFSLTNHLYREYVNPANASISSPAWPDEPFLAGR